MFYRFQNVWLSQPQIKPGILKPNREKFEQLQTLANCWQKSAARSFLGLCNYYWKFVPNLSIIAALLTDQYKAQKPSKVEWSDACEHSFRTLKSWLTSDAVVRLPDLTKEFVVWTNASKIIVGACILQELSSLQITGAES